MKQQEHLNDTQIEQYARTGSAVASESDGNRPQIEAHLEDCASCRERVLASVRMRFSLAGDFSVKVPPNLDPPDPDCPDEDVLRNFAAGNNPANDAAKLLDHISRCDRCGPVLRMYTEDFSDELTADDMAVLSGMKSSSPAWQKEVVEAMSVASSKSSPEPSKKTFSWQWALVPGVLATCAAVALAVWYQQRETPEKVERLLAQAYTQHRTMDARFPDAAWGRMDVTQGRQSESFQSPFLLEAEAIVDQRIQKDPENVEWLRVKAQSEMLQWHLDPAIESLTTVVQKRPDLTGLTLDLAIAYLQRAEQSNNRRDYEQSLSLFNQILKENPSNEVALFNRALAYEQLPDNTKAMADWTSLIKTERDSGWAKEARERLDKLQER